MNGIEVKSEDKGKNNIRLILISYGPSACLPVQSDGIGMDMQPIPHLHRFRSSDPRIWPLAH